MQNPELRNDWLPTAPEEVLMEAYALASAPDSEVFLHDSSEQGYMFDTGNFGGYDKYFANDAYRTIISFDFSEFDNYPGRSQINTSIFRIRERCLISFFNIERDNGDKFTYGIMLELSGSGHLAELIHHVGDDAWGSPVSPHYNVRRPIMDWLRSGQLS